MIWLSSSLTKNYGWELALFLKFRDFKDGIRFLEIDLNWDRYLADHTPRFEFRIAVFNFTLIEFNIYYLHHRDEEE